MGGAIDKGGTMKRTLEHFEIRSKMQEVLPDVLYSFPYLIDSRKY
jgi:hypothetical protein